MYSNAHAAMPPPQSRSVAPETFLLAEDAQQSLPPEAIVALQQVDNCESLRSECFALRNNIELYARRGMPLIATPYSKILPHLCASRLEPRPVYQTVSAADW